MNYVRPLRVKRNKSRTNGPHGWGWRVIGGFHVRPLHAKRNKSKVNVFLEAFKISIRVSPLLMVITPEELRHSGTVSAEWYSALHEGQGIPSWGAGERGGGGGSCITMAARFPSFPQHHQHLDRMTRNGTSAVTTHYRGTSLIRYAFL